MRLPHHLPTLALQHAAGAAALAAVGLLAPGALAEVGGTSGITELVSLDWQAQLPAHYCRHPSISEDGRYVAFDTASALLPDDTNSQVDVYVVDRLTGAMTCASTTLTGTYGNNTSQYPFLSADGRWVAFESYATNLQQLDANGAAQDVFLKDLQTGTLVRVSNAQLSPSSGDGASSSASVSDDGRFVAFKSHATDLIAGDTNGAVDIFVRDLQTGLNKRISVGVWGQSNGDSSEPMISGDGNHVVFTSQASNLILQDNNGSTDVFVQSLQLNPKLVSRTPPGAVGNGHSGNPSISTDGAYVAFDSEATNLSAADLNLAVDSFVLELATLELELASLSQAQLQGATASEHSRLSRDGRSLAFMSTSVMAPNGLPGYHNVYVRDLDADNTWTADVPSGPLTSSAGHGGDPVLAQAGNVVAFTSNADGLVPGYSITADGIFVRTMHPDPFSYCSSSTTSAGCQPSLSSTGFASATNADFFSLVGDELPNQKSGLVFYGFDGPASNPFAGATMCVQGSKKRTPLITTGGLPAGDDCTGFFAYDLNAFAAGLSGGNPKPELLSIGQQVNVQFWGRDPASASGSFLTDALQYIVGP